MTEDAKLNRTLVGRVVSDKMDKTITSRSSVGSSILSTESM